MRNSKYHFNDFTVDEQTRELRRGGEEVVVQPRVFDLLVYLLANRERAVDKDELQEAVWTGMFITDTALTRAVMKARKAVDDDASEQKVIKTLHGHGYRFVAEVTEQSKEEHTQPQPPSSDDTVSKAGYIRTRSPASPDVPSATATHSSQIRWPAWAGGFILIALLVLAWINWSDTDVNDSQVRIAVLPVVNSSADPELSWTRLGLMSFASGMLKSETGFEVVADGRVMNLTENFGWTGSLQEAGNEELLSKLQQALGASHVLSMRLEDDNLALRLNYDLLTLGAGVTSGTVVGDRSTGLARDVVERVYGSLSPGRRSDGQEVLMVSKDPFNNEAFARGMSLTLQGRCEEARQLFKVIIDQEPTLFEPRYEYAACLRILGEWQEAELMLKALVQERRADSPNRPLSRALVTLGILYNRTGRLDEAQVAENEALEIALAIDDQALAAIILQNLSIVAEDRGQLNLADELLDRAMLSYDMAGIEVLPGQLYSAKANLAMDRNELIKAESFLAQALVAFREVGDRRNEAMMINNTGYLKARQGLLDEAESYHLRSLEMRQEIGDKVGVGRIYGMLAGVYAARGHYAQSLESAQAALEIARETRDRLFEGTAQSSIAQAHKGLRDFESSRLSYFQAKAVFVEIQDYSRALQVDVKIAGLDMEAGRLDAAETLVLTALQTARKEKYDQTELQAMEMLGDIAMAREDTAAAIEEYLATLTRVREASWTSKEISVMAKLAGAYMDIDDLDSAAPLIGALSPHIATATSSAVSARYAFLGGNYDSAFDMQTAAKALAGDNWTEQDELTLKNYRSAGQSE